MDEKRSFIKACLSGEYTMTECCRLYGISRETGHKLWRRFCEQGEPGLVPRPRVANRRPHTLDTELAHRLLQLRRRRPSWGPLKLLSYMARHNPELKLPAASTVGELLKREGLVRTRKRRVRPAHQVSELGGYFGPNAVWCADYKGQFRCGNGRLCYPLTISDGYSRALLRCQGVQSTDTHFAKQTFDSAFREFGLPDAIRTDNGSPFSGPAGLSRLSVWWVRLGIRPLRITPGKPTQNGRHERIHRTLVDDVLCFGVENNLRAQQRALDRFVHDYNQERPHQALSGDTPFSRYVRSTKPYPTKLRDPHYPDGAHVERINKAGELCWRGRRYRISSLLAGQPVGIVLAHTGVHNLWFGPLMLGHFSTRGRFLRGPATKSN